MSSIESQKGIITIQDVSIENQKVAIPVLKPMAIAPFWVTTEDPSTALMPFWFSADDVKMCDHGTCKNFQITDKGPVPKSYHQTEALIG